MITFKQFIVESQNYPLYHGTGLNNLRHIIDADKLSSGGYADAHHKHAQLYDKNTISMTRSKSFASYWSNRKEWAMSFVEIDPKNTVVIQFNREKLRHNYKVLPYNHFDHEPVARRMHSNRWASGRPHNYTNIDKNQYEERVVGDIKNVSKYIEAIYMSSMAIELMRAKWPEQLKVIQDRNWLKQI